MGDYNPHLPYILGQEWVGIRDEDVRFEPTFSAEERGHRFALASPSQVNNVRGYIHTVRPTSAVGQVIAAAIYPAATSHDSGPIRRVVIPVTGALITGSVDGSTISIFGAGSATEAVYTEDRQSGVTYSFGTSEFRALTVFFDITRFAGLIKDKRILALNILYSAEATDSIIETDPAQNFNIPGSTTNTSIEQNISPDPVITNVFLGRILSRPTTGATLPLGELNLFFSGQQPSGPTPSFDRMHWNYAELLRLQAAGAQPHIRHRFTAGNWIGVNDILRIYYVALEVFYCEERRVAYGGLQLGSQPTVGIAGRVPIPQVMPITVRDITTYGTNPVLAAGQYDVVLSSAGIPVVKGITDFPDLNALRELYSMPSHTPVNTLIPTPLDTNAVGQQLVRNVTTILPQISVHTTGGTLVQPHAYGRQAAGQVYGSVTATQEIYDVPVGGGRSYPQVRYYARRFGDTAASLLLSSPTITGSTVSITPTDFDSLAEIVDGWKSVTLRFSTPPTMGAGTNPQWQWSASGENAGNRWEILGVIAPAITAQPSNVLNLVASPNRTDVATYGQPVSGGTINMGWVPGYAPLVTGTTDDPFADAVLIFSQDPPTITDVSVSVTSQAVTGFLECTKSPCCVPSAIQYNRITWSAQTTLPTTGFGYYELQRFDAVEGSWHTIMQATNPAVTGFNDYEARVGVSSSYQIRCANVLYFFGAWSVTGSATVPEPGVTLPSCGTSKRGVLIFTTNEDQDGSSNLAYAMTWDDAVVEDFSFNEAGTIDFERHHDRDYQVAFHGTERGGESFSRRLLLSNAAIALPRLANVRGLRDLAWADLAYVCVRDDIGDRWLASVVVPHSETRRNRRLYNADITVIEVTATPMPVNP